MCIRDSYTTVPSDSSDLLLRWKVATMMYEISISVSMFISLFFWFQYLFLEQYAIDNWITLALHFCPLGCLVVDFVLNNILIEVRHTVGMLIFYFIYALFAIA